jgi:hypothetical protein
VVADQTKLSVTDGAALRWIVPKILLTVAHFSPPLGLAWVVVGQHPWLSVALRAHVKYGFWIVVTCQVSWRIGTPRAELDSHVPPPISPPEIGYSSNDTND